MRAIREPPFDKGGSACQKTSLWETDSPDTGEVALAPEGERWPPCQREAQIVEKLLGPLWEGAPPAGGGGESFTQARRFRAKARLSPSGPSGLYSGSWFTIL